MTVFFKLMQKLFIYTSSIVTKSKLDIFRLNSTWPLREQTFGPTIVVLKIKLRFGCYSRYNEKGLDMFYCVALWLNYVLNEFQW